MQHRWELFVLRYGKSQCRREPLIAGGGDERIEIAWYFTVARSGDRVVAIDTGSDDAKALEGNGVTDRAPVAELLAGIGVQPDTVGDVILTHAHWDHAENLGLFPRAKIWVQRTELEYMRSIVSPGQPHARAYDLVQLRVLEQAESEGRLRLLDGPAEPVPGLRVEPAPGHTPGCQFIVLETSRSPVILSGDNAYLYENLEREIAPGFCVDKEGAVAAIRRMKEMADSVERIVPGHEAAVFRKNALVEERIARIG